MLVRVQYEVFLLLTDDPDEHLSLLRWTETPSSKSESQSACNFTASEFLLRCKQPQNQKPDGELEIIPISLFERRKIVLLALTRLQPMPCSVTTAAPTKELMPSKKARGFMYTKFITQWLISIFSLYH